jgi:hypothetical protein
MPSSRLGCKFFNKEKKMSQLADIEQVVCNHTSSDDEAAALFYDIIDILQWDVTGVTSVETAKEYLNRER